MSMPPARGAFSTPSSVSAQKACCFAYHDRSDGGLFATVCEMAFAARCGVSLVLDTLCYDPLDERRRWHRQEARLLGGRFFDNVWSAPCLPKNSVPSSRFAAPTASRSRRPCVKPGWRCHFIGEPERQGRNPRVRNAKLLVQRKARRSAAGLVGNQLPHARLRDNPKCAQQEFDALVDATTPACQCS